MRVVFPEGGDERIVAAARRLYDEALVDPILLGNPESSDRLDAYTCRGVQIRT
jgi:phosphotransacetylase